MVPGPVEVTMARDEIILLVQLYDLLLGNYELLQDEESERALEEFLQDHPNIANYDSRGNYIGASRTENGWVQ